MLIIAFCPALSPPENERYAHREQTPLGVCSRSNCKQASSADSIELREQITGAEVTENVIFEDGSYCPRIVHIAFHVASIHRTIALVLQLT